MNLIFDKKFDHILKPVVLVFLAFFPFVYFRGFLYQSVSSRFFILCILIEILGFILAVNLFKKDSKIEIFKSPIVLAFVLYFSAYIVSSIFGADLSVSFWSKAARMSGIFFWIHLITFYFLLTYIFNKENNFIYKTLKTVSFSGAVFSLLSLLSPEGVNIMFRGFETDGFTFGNSSFAAMYIFGAFVSSVYLLTKKENRKLWYFWVTPVVIFLNPFFINNKIWSGGVSSIGSILGEAKASSVAVFGFLFTTALFLLVKKIKKEKIRNLFNNLVCFGLVSFVVFVVVSLLNQDGFVQKEYLKQATSARPLVWELSYNAVKERPYLGWGPDNFDIAYTEHYDNRLLENRYGNEPWFDRAHNVIIDHSVDMGYVGVSVYIIFYLSILLSLVFVINKTKNDELKVSSVFLFSYFAWHFLELQTAFETVISLVMFVLMLAWATVVVQSVMEENRKNKNIFEIPSWIKYTKASVATILFPVLFFVGMVPITRAEIANGQIRTIGDTHERLPMYDKLFSSPVDKPSFLWRIATDFQKGIGDDPSVLNDPDKVSGLLKEVERYATEYEKYLETHPDDYRSWINLADQYMYQSLFGGNELEKAHAVLDKAISLSPENPQAYWMKSVAYLYQADFKNARLWAQKGIDVNPNIEQSQEVKDYIESSIKSFPDVTLFYFRSV